MIFIDSSVLVAFAVEKDSNHQKALKLLEKLVVGEFGTIFTSDYIFDETTTVIFARSKSIKEAILAGEYILNSTNLLKVEEESFKDAWAQFKNQKLTKLSFTDCTNLSLMKNRGIRNIATFDGEFSKIESISVVD